VVYPHAHQSPFVFFRRILFALPAILLGLAAQAESPRSGPVFEVSFATSVRAQPVTGRLFVMISRINNPQVRLQSTWLNSPEILATDVHQLAPGQTAVLDGGVAGTPIVSASDIPPGDYYVQAVLSVYTEFHRADGHVIWAHMDQGEGQQFNLSPGNLYSAMQLLHVDRNARLNISLSEIIPALEAPKDTQWVKHVSIQSKLLTEFWGRPIYLGATVLLPRDYDSHPGVHYPVIYDQPQHFRSFPPFEFRTDDPLEPQAEHRQQSITGYESGYGFYRVWQSTQFPRMIAISFLTPTPLADWSGAVDSSNNGPYGKAILTELIPYLEEHFRIIRQPYARMLTGKASGARAALALQVQHPDFFGGVWAFRPWPFSFRHYFSLNIYESDNAFTLEQADLPEFARNADGWLRVERYFARTTRGTGFFSLRQASQHDAVMASMAGGDCIGADDAILGPVGDDGLPRLLWDRATGKIDRQVAAYWREHGDLAWYIQKNWSRLAPDLNGKLHIYADELDEFSRNYGVHQLAQFLQSTPAFHATVAFSNGLNHQAAWTPMTHANLVRAMADHIKRNAPQEADTAWQHL
jgi:hypothetical protein